MEQTSTWQSTLTMPHQCLHYLMLTFSRKSSLKGKHTRHLNETNAFFIFVIPSNDPPSPKKMATFCRFFLFSSLPLSFFSLSL